jgi:superfamily II DNA or RNA helicase
VRLEDLALGSVVSGVTSDGNVTVVAVDWSGPDAVVLTYRDGQRRLDERILYRSDEPNLRKAEASEGRPFDAPGADFRLAAEAQRIKMAGLFDPMLAVATSDVRPLPHQIRAVYGELLPRTPLRFLLADDPGAGKTIMAGLYIKELLLRGDLARCLIVAPGGLVEQWQDELHGKFGLEFEILTASLVETTVAGSVFDRHPLLIARMDQLARSEELMAALHASEWDLVVVDEAHRMSAHYFGNELKVTRRYELGRLLGRIARHVLLMTATPHAGKEEDFQLFLALLDPDRFEGKFRHGIHSADTSGLMRRMVKEDLLTFEGKPLFPERIAETVPYELSALESELYEQVTHYVREEMNRADKLEKKRGNTVGFALTILQRRLASSPEAIFRSLQRRRARLEKRRDEIVNGTVRTLDDELTADVSLLEDLDELSAAEAEELEEVVLDAATAARTITELDAELVVLDGLERLAARVRRSGDDRKWQELRSILNDRILQTGKDGNPRKLIIFTEHKDTLEYLTGRIGRLLARVDAVVAIHGGVPRDERRRRTEEFTHNPYCQVMVATDAAGEGLNLQKAHLMVNYDLPWNPNRLEQRFGRIHRIGQEEVCRLWNLVAVGTREGDVYRRLLDKIEEQRQAYGGKVFDVLGEVFEGKPLRDLLVKAILYGDDPQRRAELEQVIDENVSSGLTELLEERALTSEMIAQADVEQLRRQMDEARARRLQPHYVELFFKGAFARLGGRIARREKGRYEITHVPAALRQRDPRAPGRPPVASRYERVTFEMDHLRGPGLAPADLLAPGHPLLDAVIESVIDKYGEALARGSVLVDPNAGPDDGNRLLVAVMEEISGGTGASVAKRFGYVYVDSPGAASDAGPAPYLDFDVQEELSGPRPSGTWGNEAERAATQWIIQHELPAYGNDLGARRLAEIERTRSAVKSRLSQEFNRLHAEAMDAEARESEGKRVRVRAGTLRQRAQSIDARLDSRLRELDQQAQLNLKPPHVVGAALIVPAVPVARPDHPVSTKEVERRAVDAVLTAERSLGRQPEEMAHNNPGYDIRSLSSDGHLIHIEVKGRIAGANDFFITYNEVLHGKNAAPRYRLALVRVSPDGPHADEVRYIADPFRRTELGSFTATGITGDWNAEWARGTVPF